MDTYLPASVGINDLVLLEVTVTRWPCNQEGKMVYDKNCKTHRVTLGLEAVNLLFVGPEPKPVTVEDDEDGSDYEL